MKSDECVFCQIIEGRTPTTFEYQDVDFVAFADIKPSAKVHLVVIPKKHIKGLPDATDKDQEMLGRMQLVIHKIAKEKGIDGGYKVTLNAGTLQEVPHIHYHLRSGFSEGGDVTHANNRT